MFLDEETLEGLISNKLEEHNFLTNLANSLIASASDKYHPGKMMYEVIFDAHINLGQLYSLLELHKTHYNSQAAEDVLKSLEVVKNHFKMIWLGCTTGDYLPKDGKYRKI